MLGPSFHITPLHKDHDRQAFSCGSPALDRYLQQQARQDADKRAAAPFVLVEAENPKVQGYYTLSASSVNPGDLPADMAKKLPRYPLLPVTLLGRLAVDQGLKGRGAGEFLLLDALRRCFEGAAHIAALAVLVDAKDNNAAAFYRHFNFIPLPGTTARLYLPMKTVAELF